MSDGIHDAIVRLFEHPGLVLSDADADIVRRNLAAIVVASQWLMNDKIARLAREALAVLGSKDGTP